MNSARWLPFATTLGYIEELYIYKNAITFMYVVGQWVIWVAPDKMYEFDVTDNRSIIR